MYIRYAEDVEERPFLYVGLNEAPDSSPITYLDTSIKLY
jgi:hypothetical protein